MLENYLAHMCRKENFMPYLSEEYDICVVGAGHAGCEAALACA